MKSLDITNHLIRYIPLYTDVFTENVTISSMEYISPSVICTTGSAHGLTTGQVVMIDGETVKTPIENITRSNGVVTAKTSTDHDLTLFDGSIAVISGTTNFDGSHTLTGVPNRFQFKFISEGSDATETSGFLLENRVDGYNGIFGITVIDSTHFSYTPTYTPSSSSGYGAIAKTSPAISAYESSDILQNFIKSNKNLVDSLFCVVEGSQADKRYDLTSQVTAIHGNGADLFIPIIDTLSVYFLINRNNLPSNSGAYCRDLAEDMKVPLFKTLVGWNPESDTEDSGETALTYVSDGMVYSERPYYVHQYIFQRLSFITKDVIFNNIETRAFRDINGTLESRYKKINLDEDPYEY